MSGQSRRTTRMEGEKWTLHDLRGRSVQSIKKTSDSTSDTLEIVFPRGVKFLVRPGVDGHLSLSIVQEKMVKQDVEFPVEK